MKYSFLHSFKKNSFLLLIIYCSLFSNTILFGSAESMPNSDDNYALEESAASATPTMNHQHSTAEALQLNQLYAEYNKQLNTIESSIQHLSQLVATQKITPSNPYAAYEWLQNISGIINKARKLPYAPLTSKKLVHFFNFNKTLVKSIASSYQNSLNIRPPAESLATALEVLQKTVQAESATQVPLQIAVNYANESSQLVDTIALKISKSGLSWYNHAYRKAASFNKNFHVSSTLLTIGGLAALTHAVILLLPEDFFYTKNATTNDIETYKSFESLARYKKNWAPGFDPENKTLQRYEQLAGRFGMAITGLSFLDSKLQLSAGMSKLVTDFDAFLKGTTADNSKQFIKYVDDMTLADPMFDCVRDQFGPFNTILRFLENPDQYINTNTNIPKCVLLTGTPGSGKTLSARALAGSINKLFGELGHFEKCGFIDVEPWALPEIDEVIAQARANAPCVIFIDEFHLFGGGAQINSNAMWLSKLLTEIDKIDKSKDPTQQIFILAATNRPDLLSIALLRHGRFGKDARVEFPVPSHEQRKSVFNALCKKSAVDTTGIDLDYLAKLTQGESFSAINKVFERAGFIAKQHAEGITYDYLYQALNEVIRGLNQKVHLSDYEKDIVAVHFAGIALAHLLMDTTVHLESITIKAPSRPITEQLEFLAHMENKNNDMQHVATHGAFYSYLEHESVRPTSIVAPTEACKLLLAGRVAQTVVLKAKTSYGKHDKELAYEEALTISLDGYKLDKLSKADQEHYQHEAHKLVMTCEKELEQFFIQHKETVRTIADSLKEKEFLTADQIKALIK
jgi:AAA+ superfamily predicted ATPase